MTILEFIKKHLEAETPDADIVWKTMSELSKIFL